MSLVAGVQAAEVLKPGEQALDLPSALVALEYAPVLGLGLPVTAVWRDQLDAVLEFRSGRYQILMTRT
jgi:hypothetical protein